VDQRTVNNLSLCSGGAGLDLGLELVIPNLRTVCWVEWEAFAINYLVETMEAGCLAQAPVWSDLRTFDGRPWRGVVDCLTAGYPCQPFSLAGKRRGQDDPRHLWPHVRRIIEEVEPTFLFLENVPGHLSLGFDTVVSDLEALDYQVAAGLFTAAEVGASHKRERLFILAVANAQCSERRANSFRGTDESRSHSHRPKGSETIGPDGGTLGYSDLQGLEGRSLSECRCTDQQIAGAGECPSLFPPGPDSDEWLRVPRYLWPATQSPVREVADGVARTDWLRLLGNGVVPVQAAYAFLSLWSSLRV